MIIRPYTFRATLHHVWDGDTLWLNLDRGERLHSTNRYRLWGVNTPEVKGKGVTPMEKVYGEESKVFVADILRDIEFHVSTHKGDTKYDWSAEIWVGEDFSPLATAIIAAGHGVEYFGGTKKPWDERKKIQDAVREENARKAAEGDSE